jgi:hypothetical protein
MLFRDCPARSGRHAHVTIATFAVIALVTATTTAMRAGGVSHVHLTVRLYNTAGIPAPELISARYTATSILGDGGLDMVVRHCGRAGSTETPPDSCSETLRPTEVVVRIIDAPAFNAALNPDAFGLTYVVQETDRGWLATVFADRIERAAARAGVATGTLLGRVMAHELGHLLLGSGYHGPAGLMRAEWPDATLPRSGADWRFSIGEAARMHQALDSMSQTSSATETNLLRDGSDKLVALNAPIARR